MNGCPDVVAWAEASLLYIVLKLSVNHFVEWKCRDLILFEVSSDMNWF